MKAFQSITTSTITKTLTLLALGSALIGMHGSAMALTTQNGSICKPYGNSNIGGLISTMFGVGNNSGAPMGVICPVVRTVAAPAGGFSVWVDGAASANETTSCTLYSVEYNGTYLGAVSFSSTGSFSRLLTLPQAQVTTFSSQSVYCLLPASGAIWDIEPAQ